MHVFNFLTTDGLIKGESQLRHGMAKQNTGTSPQNNLLSSQGFVKLDIMLLFIHLTRVAETPEETEARLAKWSKFLESEEGKKASLVGTSGPDMEDDNDQDSDQEEDKVQVKNTSSVTPSNKNNDSSSTPQSCENGS